MKHTTRSVDAILTFPAALLFFITSPLSAEAAVTFDFESGGLEKWRKSSAETEVSLTTENLSRQHGKNALLAGSTARKMGIEYLSQISVTAHTVIEFDIRIDAQMSLAYFAFTATDEKKRLFWLWSSKANAIKNPKRGEWIHVVFSAAALQTDKKEPLQAGDTLTKITMFQVQENGCPHRFMIDNFKVYDAEGAIEAFDGERFVDKVNQGAPTTTAERTTDDALPLVTVTGMAGALPTLDGELGESAWQNASGFSLLPNYTGKSISENTAFSVFYDSDNLYIGITAGQRYLDPVLNQLDKAKCKTAKRDGPAFHDDSVEIFLMPGGDYYQLVVNSDGVLFDAKNKDASWNAKGVRIATKKNERTWTAEIAIPLAEIGGDPSVWRANFYRNNPACDESSSWSPTEKSYHTPNAFGFLSFDKTAPAVRGESFVVTGGTAAIKLYSGTSKSLTIRGAQSGMALNPMKANDLLLKPDADGIGQIRIALDKELFRTPAIAIKGKSSDCVVKFASEGADLTVFVNGRQAASSKNTLESTVNLDEDKNILALTCENTAAPVNGFISFSDMKIPISDFLFSEKAADGWEKNGFDDASWALYDGRVSKKIHLRYTLIRNHTIFAPQLEKDTCYIANKAAMKLTFRITSPFEKPTKNYRAFLEVPESIKIPTYRPDLRLYNTYSNTLVEKKHGGTNRFIFSFEKSVPKLAYNWGYHVITMIVQPDFPAEWEGKTVTARAWMSGTGVHEIPLEFKIKILPELNGRQPKNIPIITWATARDQTYATMECQPLLGTWKNAGFTMIGDEIKARMDSTFDNLSSYSEWMKKNNLTLLFLSFLNHDKHWASEDDKANPESQFVSLSSVKESWKKPLCPLYFMKSKDIAARIARIALSADYFLHDIENGVNGSCLCRRCCETFAKMNHLDTVPDEKTILTRYKESWVTHQVEMNRRVFEYTLTTARSAHPTLRSAVYSGYATTPPERYGMDWSLYPGVDLATAGYDENRSTIMTTRKALGGRPICPGLILETDAWEKMYADQNISARLWKQLIAGGFGGVHIWDFTQLDGRGLTAVARFSRGVAEFENTLNEKNQIPSAGLIANGREGNDFAYKKGKEYLLVAINDTMAPRTVNVKLPPGVSAAKVENYSTGMRYPGKMEFEVSIAPHDVMLLNIIE